MPFSTVTYQELYDLDSEYDDFNVELLRYQAEREQDLNARRNALVKRIQGFWPMVFEQAPQEIEQYIQPTDADIFGSSLINVEVDRFEAKTGDPRSISIKLTFKPNDYFEDTVIEKRFWYRQQAPTAASLAKLAADNEKAKAKRAASGKPAGADEDEETYPSNFAGLVSEPVTIRWKEGKDPTNGLLDLAAKVYAEVVAGKGDKENPTENQKALSALFENTAVGGLSFFAWFGFVGRVVSAAESKAAAEQDAQARKARSVKWAERAAKYADAAASGDDAMDEDEEEEEDDDDFDDEDDEDEQEYQFEIFPAGDDVANCIAEDIWPNALKYFMDAQDGDDDLSELDSDAESDEDAEAAPPLKKQKN